MTIHFLLFITGLFAGTVDAIAGGGGLISLPVLLSLGLPPHLAFGTNKLQGTMGTLIATVRYYRAGLIDINNIYLCIFLGLMGSIGGALIGQTISNHILHKIIPFLLLAVLVYTLFSPHLGHKDEKPRMQQKWFYMIFGFSLGLYDGFFGPGTGSLWVFFLTFFLGFNLVKSTAYTKIFNLNSSLIATICFAYCGNIDYSIALVMALGQLIGGRIGASLAIKKGSGLIRPLYVVVVSSTIVTLSYRSYTHSDLFTQITQQVGLLPQIMIGSAALASVIFFYLRINKRHKDQAAS